MRSNDNDTKEQPSADPGARADRISAITECVRANTYAVDLVELAAALTTNAMEPPEK